MKITAISRQNRLRVNLRVAEELARFFLHHRPGPTAPIPDWNEIVLTFVAHKEMCAANMDYFGKNGTTDVISAAYTPLPGDAVNAASADIIVNAELAREEGFVGRMARNGLPWGCGGELALYIAHGCDHLLGGEDSNPVDRRRMRRRELGWIHKAQHLHLLDGLVQGEGS